MKRLAGDGVMGEWFPKRTGTARCIVTVWLPILDSTELERPVAASWSISGRFKRPDSGPDRV